jgi:hypothetical protein
MTAIPGAEKDLNRVLELNPQRLRWMPTLLPLTIDELTKHRREKSPEHDSAAVKQIELGLYLG